MDQRSFSYTQVNKQIRQTQNYIEHIMKQFKSSVLKTVNNSIKKN